MKNDKKTGPTMTPKDLGSNCLSYLQVTDPSGFFSSVSFFRHIFQVYNILLDNLDILIYNLLFLGYKGETISKNKISSSINSN